ncbi:hypothetical protein BCEP4_1160012 [Burkholderia cepacia]|nr:hypothetical protein BCEP4_1160012 [Burkholderia cepacia]
MFRLPDFSIVAIFDALNCIGVPLNGTGSIYNSRHLSPGPKEGRARRACCRQTRRLS